ncbi:MAG: zinc-dependent metalloprotease [Bacteroidia bacterium]|nr:zinc-dependent metalloprotease [Bacteroidia bacterium]
MVLPLAEVVMRWIIGVFLFVGVGLSQRYCPVDRAFLRLSSSLVPERRGGGYVDTIWIPVVFHVVGRDSSGWLPPDRIGAQLRALNRDFGLAGIQFYIPRYGPGGQPTCGVTWTISPLGWHDWTAEEDTLKRLVSWPVDSFINIWVVEYMPFNTIGYARSLGDTAGMAGIVLVRDVVGDRVGVRPPFHYGRTAVHEMGHVLSLYHPFEGGCVGMTPQTCATEGDEICDTPPQRQPHYGCPPATTNTCQETPDDLPDPVDNFMGYVDDSCMHRFTSLQIGRMRDFLQQQGGILISEANRWARGWYEHLSPDCAAVAFLESSPSSQFSLRRDGSYIKIQGGNVKSVSLYDGFGRLIRRGNEPVIGVEALPAGLYLLQVEGERSSVVFRFLEP